MIAAPPRMSDLPPDLVAAGWALERVDESWRAYNEQCSPPIQTMEFSEKADAVGSAISMQQARAEGLLGLMGDTILRPRPSGQEAAPDLAAIDLAAIDLDTIPGLAGRLWRRRKVSEPAHFWSSVSGPEETSIAWHPFCAAPIVVRGRLAHDDNGDHCRACERTIMEHIRRLDTTTDVGVTYATSDLPLALGAWLDRTDCPWRWVQGERRGRVWYQQIARAENPDQRYEVTIPQLQALAEGADLDELNPAPRRLDGGGLAQRWPNKHPRYPDSVLVEIARLDRVAGTQMRAPRDHDDSVDPRYARLDWNEVQRYRQRLLDGEAPPPIEVVHDSAADAWYPWDAFHRLAAADLCDYTHIWAIVREGTLDDALDLAASANADHGVKRTDQDLAFAVWTTYHRLRERLRVAHGADVEPSQREIARICNTNHRQVGRVLRRPDPTGLSVANPAPAAPSGVITTMRGGRPLTINASGIAESNARRAKGAEDDLAVRARAVGWTLDGDGAVVNLSCGADQRTMDRDDAAAFITLLEDCVRLVGLPNATAPLAQRIARLREDGWLFAREGDNVRVSHTYYVFNRRYIVTTLWPELERLEADVRADSGRFTPAVAEPGSDGLAVEDAAPATAQREAPVATPAGAPQEPEDDAGHAERQAAALGWRVAHDGQRWVATFVPLDPGATLPALRDDHCERCARRAVAASLLAMQMLPEVTRGWYDDDHREDLVKSVLHGLLEAGANRAAVLARARQIAEAIGDGVQRSEVVAEIEAAAAGHVEEAIANLSTIPVLPPELEERGWSLIADEHHAQRWEAHHAPTGHRIGSVGGRYVIRYAAEQDAALARLHQRGWQIARREYHYHARHALYGFHGPFDSLWELERELAGVRAMDEVGAPAAPTLPARLAALLDARPGALLHGGVIRDGTAVFGITYVDAESRRWHGRTTAELDADGIAALVATPAPPVPDLWPNVALGESNRIVPAVLIVGQQPRPWTLPDLEIWPLLKHTDHKVQLRTIDGGRTLTKNQDQVICLPDRAALDAVVIAYARLDAAMQRTAQELRRMGTYAAHLARATAANSGRLPADPVTPWVVSALEPDREYAPSMDYLHVAVEARLFSLSLHRVRKHTPQTLVLEGSYATSSKMEDHYACADGTAWVVVREAVREVWAAQAAWAALRQQLGTYKEALADGRYSTNQVVLTAEQVADIRANARQSLAGMLQAGLAMASLDALRALAWALAASDPETIARISQESRQQLEDRIARAAFTEVWGGDGPRGALLRELGLPVVVDGAGVVVKDLAAVLARLQGRLAGLRAELSAHVASREIGYLPEDSGDAATLLRWMANVVEGRTLTLPLPPFIAQYTDLEAVQVWGRLFGELLRHIVALSRHEAEAAGIPVPAPDGPWSEQLWAADTAERAAAAAARSVPALTFDEIQGGVQAADAWLVGCVEAPPAAEQVRGRLARLDTYAQILEGEPQDAEAGAWAELRARVAVLRETMMALGEALDDWEATRVGDVRMLVQGTVDEVNFKTTLDETPLGTLRYAAALAIATGHKSRVASIGRAIKRRGQAAAA